MSVTLKDVSPDEIPQIKSWLIDPDNSRWLSSFFQDTSLRDEQLALFLMRREKKTCVVLLDGRPVGIVGLTDIDRNNRTAEIWGITGDKNARRKGAFTQSFALMLRKAFTKFNLYSVNAWVVDGNPSAHALERLGFIPYGRQRTCHLFEGVLKDRIHFDILASEFESSRFSDLDSEHPSLR